MKYVLSEPNLILLGDFNLPLESNMHNNNTSRNRAKELSDYFTSLGLLDCWKDNDVRITQKVGRSRLDRILYRLNGKYNEDLTTDWTFTVSDHCLLSLTLTRDNVANKPRNSRTVSLPAYILQCKEDAEKIGKGLEEFSNMIDPNWGADTKLEFLKFQLRIINLH